MFNLRAEQKQRGRMEAEFVEEQKAHMELGEKFDSFQEMYAQ